MSDHFFYSQVIQGETTMVACHHNCNDKNEPMKIKTITSNEEFETYIIPDIIE